MRLPPSQDPALSGRSLGDRFRVCRCEGRPDYAIIESILRGGATQQFVSCVISAAIPTAVCKKFQDRFIALIRATDGGSRPSYSDLGIDQIGATQFGNSGADYFTYIASVRSLVDSLLSPLSSSEQEYILLEHGLRHHFASRNVIFSPSRFRGQYALPLAARSWRNNTSLVLEPHEDIAQLEMASRDCFEISYVRQVVAQIASISTAYGSSLLVWDIAPDADCRRRLGLQYTGYPYPLSSLHGYNCLRIPLGVGDLCFLNANFIHAVEAVPYDYRITAGRFLGFSMPERLIYWN